MIESGKGPLGPFAFYVLRPTWIGGEPDASTLTKVAWKGEGLYKVPITALRDGTIVFEFDNTSDYAGGAVPAYSLPEDRKIPKHVSEADRARIDLAYRRFDYMNAFLAALHSSLATVQGCGTIVQAPVDPTNYFVGDRTTGGWHVLRDLGRKVDYPLKRGDNIETRTLDHSLAVLQKFHAAVGAESLGLLSLTYTACHQYSRHQFSSAHLIAWATIEALQNVIWQNLQKEIDVTSGGHTAMSKDRRKLLAGRDYSASVVSQILSINRKIDDEMLARLDSARRKRNAFAHTLAPIDADDAAKALRLATDLTTRVAGIPVTSSLSTSFWL